MQGINTLYLFPKSEASFELKKENISLTYYFPAL